MYLATVNFTILTYFHVFKLGMGIPIGKLSLYCAAGGIAPHRVLPVTIDVGTDNEEFLEDPFYLGIQQKRLTGNKYYQVIDEFIQAVRNRWPNALIQFEDFSSDKAQVSLFLFHYTFCSRRLYSYMSTICSFFVQTLLNMYKKRVLCFNDDIQGTGATTLAGCLGALRGESNF